MLRTLSTILVACVLTATASAGNARDVEPAPADSSTQAQTADGQAAYDGGAHEDYAKYFFLGFRHPSNGMAIASPLLQAAYTRGQAFWRDHPAERAQVFAAHGYVAIEREGFWSRGFERDAFEPGDGSGAGWWIESLGDQPWSATGLAPNGLRSHVRIVGYLSPKGQYGHLGGYEHELLVSSGVRIEAGQH